MTSTVGGGFHRVLIQILLSECHACQSSLHVWGRGNSVRFDPGKESFHILHRTRGLGDDFDLLGIRFDVALRMHSAISLTAREAGWRLQSLLRPRRFFTRKQIMNLYKSQVLSYIEAGVSGYYHAAPTVIRPMDRVQERLLRELAVTQEDALVTFHLAPLQSTRDTGMFGLLHRAVLGETSEQLRTLFPLAPIAAPTHLSTRLSSRRHASQLREPAFHTGVLRRSIFGLTVVYNLLPGNVVSCRTVKRLQSALQSALKVATQRKLPNWQALFSPYDRPLQAAAFQDLFEYLALSTSG